MFSPIQIIGTANGHTLGHGVEASLGLEFLLKGFATSFQQGHIRFAVVNHFLTEIKGHITMNLVSMPIEQLLFLFGNHPIGMEKFQIGDPTHVLLVIGGVEQVREEPLLQFSPIERGREAASGMGKKQSESMNLKGPLLKDNTLAPTVSWSTTSRCCW